GLPSKSSLARLLAEHKGVRNRKALPKLAIEQILSATDAHYDRHGTLPDLHSGAIEDLPGETWSGVNSALHIGGRGLPGGLTLVVSPLIALMKDQCDSLAALGIPATFVNSSISLDEQQARFDRLRKGKVRLLYVAPERLRSASFQRAVSASEIECLVVDEAHC